MWFFFQVLWVVTGIVGWDGVHWLRIDSIKVNRIKVRAVLLGHSAKWTCHVLWQRILIVHFQRVHHFHLIPYIWSNSISINYIQTKLTRFNPNNWKEKLQNKN